MAMQLYCVRHQGQFYYCSVVTSHGTGNTAGLVSSVDYTWRDAAGSARSKLTCTPCYSYHFTAFEQTVSQNGHVD